MLKYVLLGLALALAALFASDALFWKRYFRAMTIDIFEPPLDWYSPGERVAGGGAVPLPTATPEEAGVDRAALEAAAEYAGAHNSEALVVARDGKVIFERYWHGTGPDTVFSSHSFHKTLVGMLVGAAIADGRIDSADQPAQDFLPEWAGDGRAKVTLRHLLTMTAPIRLDFKYHPFSSSIRTFIGTDLVRENLKLPMDGEPGAAFAHLNTNTQSLGIVLERATGRRYADYLSEKLWQPIGAGDGQLWLDREGGMPHTDCCYLSRTIDWIRVGELLRNDGVWNGRRLLPEGWVREMTRGSTANPNYGFQVWVGSPYAAERRYFPGDERAVNRASEPYAADDVFFLDGYGKKRVFIVPSKGLVILRTGKDSQEWDDARIPNLLIRGTASAPDRQAVDAAGT